MAPSAGSLTTVKFGFKIIGILLLAAFWLPSSGVHRGFPEVVPSRTQAALSTEGPKLSKARRFAPLFQLHALRLGELKNSFGRNPEPTGPTELPTGLPLGANFAANGRLLMLRTGFEGTWQFYHRTALPVRAPSRA